MTLEPSQQDAARAVLRLAIRHLDEVPRHLRAEVFDLGATLLDGAEAEDAASCSFHLREAERLQNQLL